MQDLGPGGELGRHDLAGVVEAAEHHRLPGQAQRGARGGCGARAAAVVGLVAGQVDHLLVARGAGLGRHHGGVGQQVVHHRRAGRAQGAEVEHLHGRGPVGQDGAACAVGEAGEVHQHVHAQRAGLLGHLGVGQRAHVDEAVEAGAQALLQRVVAHRAVAQRDDLELRAVVQLEHLGHQEGHGVGLEVA